MCPIPSFPQFFPWDVGALAFSCDGRTLVVGGGAPRGDNALRAYRAVPGWEPPPPAPAAVGNDARDAEWDNITGRRVERVEMEGLGPWRLVAELRVRRRRAGRKGCRTGAHGESELAACLLRSYR